VICVYNYTKLLMTWMALQMTRHNQCLGWEVGGKDDSVMVLVIH